MAIVMFRVGRTLDEKGVKGVHPLGCFPLWGREGVTLTISRELEYTTW
jgi:hypothetical protein